MVSEKNVEFSIKKLDEPVQKLIKEVYTLHRAFKKSDEGTANVCREACGDFLDEALPEIRALDGYKMFVAQLIENMLSKLKEQLAMEKERREEAENEIKALKKEMKETEALARRNEDLPNKIVAYIKAETVTSKKNG